MIIRYQKSTLTFNGVSIINPNDVDISYFNQNNPILLKVRYRNKAIESLIRFSLLIAGIIAPILLSYLCLYLYSLSNIVIDKNYFKGVWELQDVHLTTGTSNQLDLSLADKQMLFGAYLSFSGDGTYSDSGTRTTRSWNFEDNILTIDHGSGYTESIDVATLRNGYGYQKNTIFNNTLQFLIGNYVLSYKKLTPSKAKAVASDFKASNSSIKMMVTRLDAEDTRDINSLLGNGVWNKFTLISNVGKESTIALYNNNAMRFISGTLVEQEPNEMVSGVSAESEGKPTKQINNILISDGTFKYVDGFITFTSNGEEVLLGATNKYLYTGRLSGEMSSTIKHNSSISQDGYYLSGMVTNEAAKLSYVFSEDGYVDVSEFSSSNRLTYAYNVSADGLVTLTPENSNQTDYLYFDYYTNSLYRYVYEVSSWSNYLKEGGTFSWLQVDQTTTQYSNSSDNLIMLTSLSEYDSSTYSNTRLASEGYKEESVNNARTANEKELQDMENLIAEIEQERLKREEELKEEERKQAEEARQAEQERQAELDKEKAEQQKAIEQAVQQALSQNQSNSQIQTDGQSQSNGQEAPASLFTPQGKSTQ